MFFQAVTDRLLDVIKTIVPSFGLNQPYWVEIKTKQPACLYYFGPFDSHTEAKAMQHGYIEDLVDEKARGISVKIKRCLPTKLTITDEE
jgi:hypothetical protein